MLEVKYYSPYCLLGQVYKCIHSVYTSKQETSVSQISYMEICGTRQNSNVCLPNWGNSKLQLSKNFMLHIFRATAYLYYFHI